MSANSEEIFIPQEKWIRYELYPLLKFVFSDATKLAANLVKEAKKNAINHIVKQSVMGADSEIDVAHLRLHR
jgi:hypothetical protein